MSNILVACGAIGTIMVAATLALGRGTSGAEPTGRTAVATEEYGKRLLDQTTELLGPDVADPTRRFTGNRLACSSCHLGAGAEPGALNLLTALDRYPRQSPRSASSESIQDRINGCMMRSMNGRALPENSVEMTAMVAYLRFLSDQDAARGKTPGKTNEPKAFRTPERAANLTGGKKVYEQRCAACHQDDGLGLPAAADLIRGFAFHPLWGPNSFNDGAGMHRVLTAAKFIKGRMPLGRPDLTDDEAFDVAGFINSQPRPEMANLDRDYPDKTTKPVDAGFPPFADSFPLEQHRFGPFGPIEAYYKKSPKNSK